MKRPASNMGLYYHELSKDIYQGGLLPLIPRDKKKWPKNWTVVDFKTYENSPKIKLLERQNSQIDKKLSDAIMDRTSANIFGKNNSKITVENLSALINFSIALKNRGDNSLFRVHPSGGGRFSLEYYFLIKNSPNFETGIYHYNLKEHSLEFIKKMNDKNIPNFSGYETVSDANIVMFMTSIFERNMRKYGERGYRYILLEAGHVGQNVYLVADALKIPVRAIAGTQDLVVEKMLDIDGSYESLVYTIILG